MPRSRSLRVLCDVLDVSADWLLGRATAVESLGPRAAGLDEADRLALAQYIEFLVARAERRRRWAESRNELPHRRRGRRARE